MAIELVAGKVKEAMSKADAGSRDLWQVPLGKLNVIEGFNVREKNADYRAHIESLAASIVANGFYQSKPLAGYVALEGQKQVIYITDGHCRLEAAQLAKKQGVEIENLPVVVSPKGTSLEDLTVALATSNTGKPLAPYEVAQVCKRLADFGWDSKAIGTKLGYTARHVDALLELLGAPKAIRNMVAAGTVSASFAMDTLKKHGDKAVLKLEAAAGTAAAKGKKKATRKHMDKADDKPTAKAVVTALIAWEAKNPTDDAELKAVVKMAKESR